MSLNQYIIDNRKAIKKDNGHELLAKHGGEWLGIARSWIQWNAHNGDTVTWGSDETLQLRSISVREIEMLAAKIAANIINNLDTNGNLVTDVERGAIKAYANPNNWDGSIFIPNEENLHYAIAYTPRSNGSDLIKNAREKDD